MNPIVYKVVMLGESGTGKSSIVIRAYRDQFNNHLDSTIGASFLSMSIPIENSNINFHIWDTAGQERYKSLAKQFYRDPAAAIIVYDISNYSTFEQAKEWFNIVQSNINTVFALVGNKLDLTSQRRVNFEEVQNYCKENRIPICMETSAKTGEFVKDLFVAVAKILHQNSPHITEEHHSTTSLTHNNAPTTRKICCRQ